MAAIYKTVVNNTKPITLQLKRKTVNPTTGAVTYPPIPLTDAQVDLIIENAKTSLIVNAGHQDCDVVDEPNGIIIYNPESTDFSVKGRYVGDAKVTDNNADVEIIYEQLIAKVRNKVTNPAP